MKKVVQKVVAFVVHDGAVAIFRQDDDDSGIQVPAGTLREGESPAEGALREAQEETGLPGLRIVRFLGRYQWDISPIREEIQDRHVFEFALDVAPPAEWTSHELHDGQRPPTALRFSWLPVAQIGPDTLVVGQATLLDAMTPTPETIPSPRPGSPGNGVRVVEDGCAF